MSTTTTRMALYKPAADGAEFVNVVTDLNNNWDKIDSFLGFASCTSSTRPSVVWNGICIRETDTNRTYVSNGSAPASGSWVEIFNASNALTPASLNITGSASGSDSVTVKVTGDSQQRFIINGNGVVEWGSGSAAVDTNLYRSGVDTLSTDDTFIAPVLNATAAASGTSSLIVKTAGDTQNRLAVTGSGIINFGTGGVATDTNLYRSGVGALTTDGDFTAGGNLHSTNITTLSWTTYTPTWGATGSAPAIGNGTLQGRYAILGKSVIVQIAVQMGTTTTFGSGQYNFSVPYTSANVGSTNVSWTGGAQGHSSTAWYNGVAVVVKNNAAMRIYGNGDATGWGSTLPFTWTAATTSYFNAEVIYEAA